MPKLPKVSTSRRKDNPEARMSIGDHLRELRNRVIISAIGVIVGAVVGYLIYDEAFAVVTYPITEAIEKGARLTLNFNTVLGSFDMKIRISMWLGVILSSPLWMYQFWAYVGPGMTAKEKRYTWAYGVVGLLLFLCGVSLGIFLLPHAVTILTGFIPQGAATSGFIDASPYLSFVMRIILVFGLAFLLPEVMVALNQLGLVKGTTLLKGWRWAVVIIFAFMAVANPLPDPWSMIFMALPITGLYFLACYIAIRHDKRVARKRAALDAELDAALAAPAGKQLPAD
ncbi:MAG: twin-arginine translocase subunit TatC [Actinomyces bowdenii]|nr:twin-arginine translocase subunit TatC [Actinomyces bowdenii]